MDKPQSSTKTIDKTVFYGEVREGRTKPSLGTDKRLLCQSVGPSIHQLVGPFGPPVDWSIYNIVELRADFRITALPSGVGVADFLGLPPLN